MIKTLSDLLLENVQNLYFAEEQMLQAMPSIIEKAKHNSLKNALEHHLGLTHEQKERLLKIASIIGEHKTDKQVKIDSSRMFKGITGLIEEAKDILHSELAEDVIDAAIIAAVQKMEHYEISCYGTAVAYARQLRMGKAEALLNETLDEEYQADDLLTALATTSMNKEAVHEDMKRSLNESEDTQTSNNQSSEGTAEVHINERSINSPGGRAGTSHRRYGTGESRGH